MNELLTAAQIAKIEETVVERDEAAGLEPMRWAADCVSDLICEHSGESEIFTFLCGPGFTGVLAAFVACSLAARGQVVRMFHCDEPQLIRPVLPPSVSAGFVSAVQHALRHCCGADLNAQRAMCEGYDERDVLVDAVFGRELTRPVPMYWREILGWSQVYGGGHHLVALELPSGYSPQTGEFIDYTASEIEENGFIVEMKAEPYDLTIGVLGDCPAWYKGTAAQHCGKCIETDVFYRPGRKKRHR